MFSTDRLMMAGAFTTIFAGYLFSKGPSANNAQLMFRVGLLGVGIALLLAGLILRARHRG